MSTPYRSTDLCAPTRSSLSFGAHTLHSNETFSIQQLTDSTRPPATGKKRDFPTAFGEYDGSSFQPRKKRKIDENPHPNTREYSPETIASTESEMVGVVDTAKLHQPPTPPASPPNLNAILRTGPQTPSASSSTKSANVPYISTLAAPLLTLLPITRGVTQSSPESTTSPRIRSKSKKEPTVIPPKSMFVPMPRACGHTLHPAYTGSYVAPLCPRCRFEFALDQLRVIQRTIENKGGARHWGESDRVKAPLNGGDKRHPGDAFAIGMDISHRHCKKRLANLMVQLETKAAEEAEWEKQEMQKYPWLNRHQVSYLYFSSFSENSARNALLHYSQLEAEGCLTLVDDHSSMAAHDHAMTMPIDNEEVSKTHAVKKPDNNVPMADVYNPHFLRGTGAMTSSVEVDPPSKRVRRNPRANVSFNAEVKVCVENDVDAFHENASTQLVTTDTLPPSILRTTDNQKAQNSAWARPSIGATTNSKFETADLKLEAAEGTKPRRQKQFTRHHSAYSAGQWACSSGGEIIDTSGASKSFEEFECYNTGLNIEFDRLDAADEQDLTPDDEMASAPTKDTPSDAGEPSGHYYSELLPHVL